nr:delta(12)-fatty-acid desaturase FAD2 [Tanacetum cinerariifolium]
MSDIGLLSFSYLLYKVAMIQGFAWVFCVYGGALMVMNAFLVTITYLHHTHASLPHYDDSEWNWMKGAFSTVDRDYGILNKVFHNITDTHVLHHLFSYIPHYHAMEATKAIRPVLGEFYQSDSTPYFVALWRESKNCLFIEPDESDEKNKGIYWYRNDLALVVSYVVNGVEYRNGYYLADGIYPEWASFVKSFTVATDPKHTYFKQRQESERKDVERAFGVLQRHWGLIQQPVRACEVNTLRRIMYVGIIMHNMILEDQSMSIVDLNHVYSNPARSMQTMWIDRCESKRRKAKELRDRDTHISLQQNLMNHIWREVEEASKED